ncbi:MAG: efflux RND transporter permease subunit, partial [Planctomycetes bacterium]|nr:efflux RND transporter permease subunit [Planctomycetota bacterium]
VVPYLAPDATALGQIFWYTVEGEGRSLEELRSIQDWYVRYQLNSVPGVAQVSSVGGFPKEYQIDVTPEKLRAYNVTLGQIFWYTVEGEGKSLDELRAIQDYYVRYQLNAVPGVAEVAGVGGFVREYQIDVDPEKLRAFDLSLGQVFGAVAASNSSVGGKVIHKGGSEYLVRGFGWIRGLDDIRNIVVAERKGVPITVDRLGTVQLGPAFRRSVLEKNGSEAVGGVVMMRYGENPLTVTDRVKEKISALQAGLPEGVRVVPFYDRTGLIHASIDTLKKTLVEEIIIASLVVLLVLVHFRSAFVICATLPLAVLVSFIFMYYLKIPSNIMSLSGIAISIGVLVDAGIVMTENAYHRLHDHFKGRKVTGDTREIVIDACKVVGGPIFFSILIMLLSFGPVFVLGGMEGRMFNPLAYTKSFALLGVGVLVITLVPAIIPTFIRGRLKSQEDVWLVRSFLNIYKPMLDFFIRHPDVIVVITGLFLLFGLPIFPQKVPWIFFTVGVPFLLGATVLLVARHKLACFAILFLVALASFRTFKPLGEEFMPPLDELAIMDMPTTRPNVNITQAGDDIKERDKVLRGFPEVHQVVGKVGRAETPTDPAPVDMVETVVSMRPKDWWPKRKLLYEDALAETESIRAELERRGVPRSRELANTATMGAIARFDRAMREFSMQRLREAIPEKGRELVRLLRNEILAFLRNKGALRKEIDETRWIPLDDRLVAKHARAFDEWILLPDVTAATREIVDALTREEAVESRADLLVGSETTLTKILDPLRSLVGIERRQTLAEKLRNLLEKRHHELMVERVKRLNWEIQDRAPGTYVWFAVEELLRGGDAPDDVRRSLRADREPVFARVFLWQKSIKDVQEEMDSELQVPGWGNIWTKPIQNRVDMLATGVRTQIGVKIYGNDIDTIQRVSEEVAAIVKKIPGAVDVFPDQIAGENYVEITIDREKAARYGVRVKDIQDVIEVALGGMEITTTVEGRNRFPVRVRYPRDWREDEERIKGVLVPAGTSAPAQMGDGMDGMSEPEEPPPGRLRQIPLSTVADVKIAPGPSMIKSEDGRLRSYVQLNVRNRDIVGFVEEARQAVESRVKLPAGVSIEWGGQFEHQVHAQRTLTIVFPLVVLIIFLVLYMTYKDLPDTFMMFLAVPGAVAGGAIFQYIFGYDFSVAVWIGYIACFGLATETGIVMLVYLREAIDRRGGLQNIRSEREIHDAVMEGAVQRLRPKLLTEGTTILALIPMLWATGVGAEFMRPMAAPILGGILVADEVIDILIPVLFYSNRCRRWRKLRRGDDPVEGQAVPIPPGALE